MSKEVQQLFDWFLGDLTTLFQLQMIIGTLEWYVKLNDYLVI
jgi:hypothetical protein